MTTGRFQRSEDGQTWEDIDPKELRRKLSGYFKDVELCVAAMIDGQQIRTPFAFYRLTR